MVCGPTIKGLLGPRRELLLYQSLYVKEDTYTGESSWVQEEGQSWAPESGGRGFQQIIKCRRASSLIYKMRMVMLASPLGSPD